MKEALLIFAKNLVPGKVKTRLAATIGNDKAFAVYRQLLQHTAAVTWGLPVDKLLFYSDFMVEDDCWNGSFQKYVQEGAGLGERMANAFAAAFSKGYGKVVIIGTDLPGLQANLIMKAFQYLNENDVVIGPAKDGGYYLLGVKGEYPALFQNIAWSTSSVLQETMAKVNALGLIFRCLPVLEDIDEEKDLHHLNFSV